MSKKNSQTMAAGLTGLAVGTAAGVALTALSDPKTRQKVKDKAEKVGQQAQQTYQKVQTQARQAWKNADPQLRQTKEKFNTVKENLGQDSFPDLATKGGEAAHQAENQPTDQFRRVKDLMNH